MERKNTVGHVCALVTILIWGTTFISTKVLLIDFAPVEILFYRFALGLLALFFFGFCPGVERLANPVYLANLLFLGLDASATCFVTWNFAVRVLGAVKTSVYIYIVPVVTMATSALILHEPITLLSGVGMALTLAGLFLSERRPSVKAT